MMRAHGIENLCILDNPSSPACTWIDSRAVPVVGLSLEHLHAGLIDRAGNLKGTDFLHFYTLGSVALTHHGVDLYNMRAQAEIAAQRVPAAAGIRYLPLYPPQVSIFFAPFAGCRIRWL